MSILADLTTALDLAFNHGKYETVLELAPKLIVELSKHDLLTPSSKSNINENDLKISRKIIEVICQSSILTSPADLESFSKYISLIKPLSENTDLLWLHLISLLASGNFIQHQQLLSYYNTLLPDFDNSKYASFGKNLDICLNEGNYGGVLKSFHNNETLDKYIITFKSGFLELCRNEIGDNIQNSYKNGLKLGAARTLLYFESDLEVVEFAKQRNWDVKDNGVIIFESIDIDEGLDEYEKEETAIDPIIIVNSYAKELENIV